MNQALTYIIQFRPSPVCWAGRGGVLNLILMKKNDLKKLLWLFLLIYSHWTCYDHFKSIGNHARNIMEWVGVAGQETVKVARGAIK